MATGDNTEAPAPTGATSAEGRTEAFTGLLGLTPVLAVATSLERGVLAGGLIAVLLPIASAVFLMVRPLLPARARLPAALVLLGTLVAVADLLLRAYALPLRDALGIYLPLLTWNALIIDHLLRRACRVRPLPALLEAGQLGGQVLLFATALGLVRGLLGDAGDALVIETPAGALFVTALLLAAWQAVRLRRGANGRTRSGSRG